MDDSVNLFEIAALITDKHEPRQVEVERVRIVRIVYIVRTGGLTKLNHLREETLVLFFRVSLDLSRDADAILFVIHRCLVKRRLVLVLPNEACHN